MKRINLLPPEQRVKASKERGRLYIVLGLLLLVVALGAIYYQQMTVANGKQDELADITAQTQAVTKQVTALRPYAQIHDLRTAMDETSRALYDARVPWSTVFEEISLVIPENVRLTSLTCVLPERMQAGEAPASAGAQANQAEADITLAGKTYAHKDVAEFMTRLGLLPQLMNIQLTTSKAPSNIASTTQRTVDFTVTASLRAYVVAPPVTQLKTVGGAE